jgi:Tfp pilus assembly protein PilO
LATYQQQLAAYQQANSPTAILQQQLADAREMRDLLAQLQRMGLSGPALAQVATTASLEEMQALLASGRGGINQYEQLLGAVGQVSSQIGSSVGDAVYGQDIKEQTKELRESKEQLKHLNERIANLEKSNKAGHHGTKAAVDHLAGRIGNAQRECR